MNCIGLCFEFSFISKPIFRGNGNNIQQVDAKYNCFTIFWNIFHIYYCDILNYNIVVSTVYLDYYGFNLNHMISGYSIKSRHINSFDLHVILFGKYHDL